MILVDILLYFVLPALFVGYFFLKKKHSYFKDRNIPHVTPSLLFGNMADVGKKYHMADFMRMMYDECKYKDVVGGYYTFYTPTILLTDLELVKQITVKDFNNFADRGMYVNDEEKIAENLFSLGGEKWKNLRSKLSPAFTSGKMKLMYHTISDKRDSYVAAIENASRTGSFNIKSISSKFTLDCISSCAFGIESNTLKNENPEMIEIFKKITGEEGITPFKFLFLALFPRFSKFLNLRFFEKKVDDFLENIVTGSMKQREDNNIVRNDFLNILIQLKNKGTIDGEVAAPNEKISMTDCIAQAFSFLLGGSDTSSISISYALLELSRNPEIQEKLRKEINEKTEGTKGEITYDNLHEMKYLRQVVDR